MVVFRVVVAGYVNYVVIVVFFIFWVVFIHVFVEVDIVSLH